MPEIELPTDEDLRHWENLTHVWEARDPKRPPTIEQAVARAELVEAVAPLLHMIAMERQDEALRLEAGEVEALRAEVERLTEANQRIATSHANLTRGLQARLDEGLAPLTKRIEAVRAYVSRPRPATPPGVTHYVPTRAVLRILDGE